ncbi:MAG TPA: AraC family transcriptional regulator [Pyrinomonadaceae bacterium]|nr:AraC family transcriptional regulator [Pyrinomonadaceae bacterium]
MNRGLHLTERFELRSKNAAIYVSTHLKTGNSDLLHYHEEPHMTLLLNGGLIDKRNDGETERVPGGMMFFETGEPHQTITPTFPTKYISLAFDPNFFEKNRVAESAVKQSVENTARAKFNVLKIYKEVLMPDEFSQTSIEMLLLGLVSDKAGTTRNSPAWMNKPEWTNKVVELLHDDRGKDLSLSDLSLVAGVHPKTISRCFPRYLGCTLGEYRRRLKIERSLPLIKSRGVSLTEIAYRCDFFDQSHFTRTFREVTGFLPRQFQKL